MEEVAEGNGIDTTKDSSTLCQSGVCEAKNIPQTAYSEDNPLLYAYRWKGWIEGPRFACLPEFLKKLAQRLNVEMKMDVNQRLVRETVFFEIVGTKDSVDEFRVEFWKAVAEWKNR